MTHANLIICKRGPQWLSKHPVQLLLFLCTVIPHIIQAQEQEERDLIQPKHKFVSTKGFIFVQPDRINSAKTYPSIIRPNGSIEINGASMTAYSKSTLKTKLTDNYSLFVRNGVLSEDFAMAPVAAWSDYVFAADYRLRSLSEVDAYIKQHKHLPNIPSQAEIAENGYSLHEINVKMLEKIEELTLYTIAQENQLIALREQLGQYKALHAELEQIKQSLKAQSH